MAKRPIFIVNSISKEDEPFVLVRIIDFKWFPGMAISQKQRSIESLHLAASQACNVTCLEVSSKSPSSLGVSLSAFNLGYEDRKSGKHVSVESAFQGSKVFEKVGPFHDLYLKNSRDAKRYIKQEEFGHLIGFDFYGQKWPLEPITLFYDWLYLNSMNENQNLAERALYCDGFTDIEFNPKKSVNCQAYSAALYVAFHRRGMLQKVIESKESYMRLMEATSDWIEQTEYKKYHNKKQGKLI